MRRVKGGRGLRIVREPNYQVFSPNIQKCVVK